MITEIAPAKINLYLHVGGVRTDGLHELASLFVFARDGDVVSAKTADEISLEIIGPFATALTPFPIEDNLVLRAASALQERYSVLQGARLTLEKMLPVASGIGGGSADAAAALRALVRLWKLSVPADELAGLAFQLGADVPACLHQAPILVAGAGEDIQTAPCLPEIWISLLNPLVETPTGPIFKAFDAENPAPEKPVHLDFEPETNIIDFVKKLNQTRNDLESPAITLVPEVGAVKNYLEHQEDCLLARMSGSGATCFGLFATQAAALEATRKGQAQGWWGMTTKLYSS